MTDASQISDEAVIAKVIGGEVDAYAMIMDRYEAKLYRYVVYLIHDPIEAKDVVQETFIKSYKNLRGFNTKLKFSSWIYRIAHNEAMNSVRKVRHVGNDDVDTLPDEAYDSHADELFDKAILNENVHACIEKLEPKYREVIQLVYFESMKYDEVSDVLHIPASTVGVWLSRAKTRLKLICEKRGVKR